MRNIFVSFGVLSLFLVGCGKPVPAAEENAVVNPPVQEPERGPNPPQKISDILSYRNPAESGAASVARIFLIAGSMDNANFAQEVVDQRALWLRAGFSESDIACYYTIPKKREFKADEAQYRALAQELRNCFPASPKLIWAHLRAASQNRGADFMYVYVSSHGSEPISIQVKKPGIGFPQKLSLSNLLRSIPEADQYIVTLDALPNFMTGDINARLKAVYELGELLTDHLFTPRYLKETLAEFDRDLPKFVSIQACHSGGFLQSEDKRFNNDTLKSVENITAMAAARSDRSSFGCDPGSERTFFGGFYNEALANRLNSPLKIDWEDLFRDVNKAVSEKERVLGVKPSLPQYYSNWETASALRPAN